MAERVRHSEQGEFPAIDPKSFREAAQEHFKNRVKSMGRRLADDHEVATSINGETHSVVRRRKKEIIIVGASLAAMSVAGLLAARHHLRVKKKS